MPVARQNVTFRDAKGNTSRMSFFVDGATAALQATAAVAVITPLQALSNAIISSTSGPATGVPTEVVYGTAADYQSVEDKAIMTFQTSTGDIHRFQVPAPLASIFLADGETVDPANTLVVAYNSAVNANVTDRHGSLLAFGANGTRIRRKMHRRFNIFTKNPSLSGPGE